MTTEVYPNDGEHPATAARHARPRPLLWTGQPVKARAFQMRMWSLIIGLLGVGLIAGGYDAILQIHWTFGPLGIDWTAKAWWDAGTWWPRQLGHWPDYRHFSFRDMYEPAVATVFVMSLIAGPSYWRHRLPAWNVALRVAGVLLVGLALGILGVWLRDFELPGAWATATAAAGRPGYNWDGAFYWPGRLSAFTLLWGALVMGTALHWLWGPAGATIQGYWIDRLADRGRERERVAWYIRYPATPPTVRERYSQLWLDPSIQIAMPGKANRWLFGTITLAVVLLILLGLTGKYWAGHGHAVPYLFPGKAAQ